MTASTSPVSPEAPALHSAPIASTSRTTPLEDSARVKTIVFFDHTARLGGGELALLHLAQGLDPARFRPLVVLGETGPLQDRLTARGIETRILPLAGDVSQTRKDTLGAGSLLRGRAMMASADCAFRLARLLRSEKAALVHCNSLKADIIGGIAARLSRVPVIWHVRDRIESDYLPRPVVTLFRRLCCLIPTRIIANSSATLQTLRLSDAAGKRAPRGRVVHDGVFPEIFQENRVTASTCPVIGIVGRISPWKGQHIFVEMAARVHARYPDARFQICGSALFGEEDYAASVRAQVQRLGLETCVEFLGFRADVNKVIQDMDIVVHASTTGEPFGQVIVEGMAAGKPVIATRGGGVPEIVEDGVTGHLVPMNDVEHMTAAVLNLLENPQTAQAMGRAGYQRVLERFTIEHCVQGVESVYESLLAST